MGIALIIAFALAATAPPTPSPEQVVREAYAAFNRRDADEFVRSTSEKVRWLSVSGDVIKVETSGKEPLRAYLQRYFRRLPSVRSNIESLMVAGHLVTVHERVHWRSKKGERTQSALAVYEVREGLITNVWYYEVME